MTVDMNPTEHFVPSLVALVPRAKDRNLIAIFLKG
jgi:hypothetical protein